MENQITEALPVRKSLTIANLLFASIMAGIGGTLPTVVKLAGYYSENPEAAAPQLGLYISLMLWFFLGSVVNVALQIYNLRDAMAIGIGAPALITGFLSGQAQAVGTSKTNVPALGITKPREIIVPAPERSGQTGWLYPLITSAAADTSAPGAIKSSVEKEPSSGEQAANSSLTIVAHQTVGLPTTLIEIAGRSSSRLEEAQTFKVIGQLSSSSSIKVELPTSFDTIIASTDDKTSNVVEVISSENRTLCIYVNLRPSNDFAWAFGVARQVSIQSIFLSWNFEVSDNTCHYNDLLVKLDDSDNNTRKEVYHQILSIYGRNRDALSQTVNLLKPDLYKQFGRNGRTNVLLLLKYFPTSTWDRRLVANTREAITALQKRNFRFSDTGNDAVRELYDRLAEVDARVGS